MRSPQLTSASPLSVIDSVGLTNVLALLSFLMRFCVHGKVLDPRERGPDTWAARNGHKETELPGGCLGLGGHDGFQGPIQLQDLRFCNPAVCSEERTHEAVSHGAAPSPFCPLQPPGPYHKDHSSFMISELLFV